MNPTTSTFDRLSDFLNDDFADTFNALAGMSKGGRTRRLKALAEKANADSGDKWLDRFTMDLTDWGMVWDMVATAHKDAVEPWPAKFQVPASLAR